MAYSSGNLNQKTKNTNDDTRGQWNSCATKTSLMPIVILQGNLTTAKYWNQVLKSICKLMFQ